MSSFKDRSDYFKLIASKNKLIAHNKLLSTGGNRVSFFRINNEEELSAACKNWAHFPCVVHAGHNLKLLTFSKICKVFSSATSAALLLLFIISAMAISCLLDNSLKFSGKMYIFLL